MSKVPKPLLFVPGILVWVSVALSVATKNSVLLGGAVALLAIVGVGVLMRAVRTANRNRAGRRRVWMEGLPARARVLGISSNGGNLNDHPYVDLELEVDLDGRPPYRLTVNALISKLAIPRVQPHCEIVVHVDHADPTGVVVDAALTPYGYE